MEIAFLGAEFIAVSALKNQGIEEVFQKSCRTLITSFSKSRKKTEIRLCRHVNQFFDVRRDIRRYSSSHSKCNAMGTVSGRRVLSWILTLVCFRRPG